MIHFDDPPRLLESVSTPPELREWLQSAKQWKSSSTEVQALVRSVEGLAGVTRANVDPLMTPQPLTMHGTGVLATASAGKLLTVFVVGLATAAVGVGSWVSQHHAEESLSLNPPRAVKHEPLEVRQAPTLQRLERAPVTLATPRQSLRTGNATPPQSNGKAARVRSDSPPKAARRALPRPTAEAEEWRILQAARQSINSDPERTLALAREHARRFPAGMLSQEREAIAIEALARQGRTNEAKMRVQRFSSEYPASPYRSRAEAAVSRSGSREAKP